MKARKLFLLFSLSILSLATSLGQAPSWVAGTPSIPSTGPLSITGSYGINMTGTIYIVGYPYIAGLPNPATVRSEALAGVGGVRVIAATITINGGNIGLVLQSIFDVLNANRTHTIFFVAQSSSGVLQASFVRIIATTLPCPKIDILTGFTQPVLCVNRGATAVFQTVILDPPTSGILKGTTWSLDWGDGTITSYTSTSDYNLPPVALRTHTYSTVTSCNYVFSNTIRNPCGETRSVQYIAVVHGRDIPSDGDGILSIVNNANGSSVIQVCEGTQTVVTLRDNSTWNCQNPVLPGGLTAVPNLAPRNIEWIYGLDPDGVAFNTITGAVNVAALGSAPQTSGRISPTPYGPNSLSQDITIPATAMAGQYIRVYLKNWNICNWLDPEYVSTYVDIEVVSSPTPPTVPGRRICFGEDGTLSVSSAPVGTISWYGDAGLTNLLGTGSSFTPTETTVGNHNYWVTDRFLSGILCQSTGTQVTLTIDPLPQKPTLTHPNKNNICFDGCLVELYTITAVPHTPPAVTSYQWYRDGVLLPGETAQNIVLCRPEHSGSYTVSAVGPAPSFCLGPQSDPWYVTVHTLSNLTNPVPAVICQNQDAHFSAWTTDEVQTWQWEYSMDGGASYTTVSNGGPFMGFNTPDLTITNPPAYFSGYLFRVEIKTPPGQGGCWFKSQAAPLTVDVVPTANAGPAITICTPTPANPIYMTGATTTGTYQSAVWTDGAGLGSWTQNNNPALAYFTPSVPSASFTATLTVTGTASCGSTVVTVTRSISWSQTPTAEAGPDISRCDASPLAPFIMTGAAAGGTYSALAWSGGTGLGTWSQNANPALATFTPSVPNGSFTATITVTGSGACPGTNPIDTKTITWGQTPVADAGPDMGRCDVTPLAPIVMTNASASGTYSTVTWTGGAGLGTWTQNSNPALAAFTPSVNVGSFMATLTIAGTGACAGTNSTDTRLIEWSYAATVNAGPDQGICAAANATLAGGFGGGATSASWVGGLGTFNPNRNTLNAVYSPTAAERAAQSVTLTLTTNDPAGICLPVSDNVTISIGTMPTSAILTSSGDACFGAAPGWLNIAITGGGDPYIISYTLNGSARPNITNYYNNTHFNLGILPVGIYTYAITQIRDNCGNILAGAGINPVTFQIYQNPVANAGGDQASCGILTATLAAVPSIGIGTWSVVSGPGTVSFNPNVSDPGATITATEFGSYVLRWTEINGGICVSRSDKSVLFERTADAGPAQNLCGTLSATLAGNTPAVGQGTWTFVSGPGTVAFTPTTHTPAATATVSAYGSYVFRWTVANGVFCSTNRTVTIGYNPAGQVNKPADLVVCNGAVTAPITFTTVNLPAGATSYTWTNDNINIGLQASGSGNVPSFTANNLSTLPVTATITVTPTFTNGPLNCPGTPVTFTITVNPAGQVDQPLSRIVCENSVVAYSFTTINTAGTTLYTWTNNNTGIGLPVSGNGDISFTAVNTTTQPVTGTITVTPVFTNGGTSCPGPSKQFNITVNPEGQADIAANMLFCNGSSNTVAFTTANTGGTTTFNWTNSNTAIGLGTDGTGTFAFTATNTGTFPISATITVTPSFNNGSTDCPGPSQSFTITVNPTPTFSSPLTIPDICSNTAVSYIPTSTTAGTTFIWTRGVVAGIDPSGPVSGSDNPNENLRNLTNMTLGVVYQYTLTANGCANIQNVNVNVKPEPVIAAGQTSIICSDNTLNYHINLVNFSNPADNVTFTWPAPVLFPVSPAFTGGTARISASIQNISDIFVNTTGATGTATYTVTPYKDGCAGLPETIVINIGSEPVLDPGLNTTVCSNTPIGLILRDAAGSVTADYYNISNVVLDDGLSADAGNAVISNSPAPAGYLSNDRYLNITGVDKDVTYTVQPVHAPDCYGEPVQVVITILPQPYIIPAQIRSVCSGIPIGKEILLSPANVPAGTIFNWPAPIMSDASGQGTAGINVAADPAGKLHINDIINNTSGAPVTAIYNITAVSTFGCTGTALPVTITINPEPVPGIISGRDKICIGETNLVYNVAPVSGSIFHWTVGPEVGTKTFDFNTNAIIINAAVITGSGIISVYETNSYTCDGDASILPVQVYTQAVPENIIGPANVCAFSTQVYSVTSRAGSTYKWTIPGGAAISGDPSAATITVVFGNVGGTISVSETNIAGCVTNHNPITVTARPIPSATISGGANICEGGSIPLNIVFAGTGPYVFTYAVNGVAQTPVNTSSNPYVLNATQAGTYTIVNVSDATGCTNTGSGSALVTYYIRPTGTITGGGEVCRGGSAVITIVFTGTAPFTFTYNNGTSDLTVPNYANSVYNLTVSPAATSTYTLVSLVDGNSCNGTLAGSAVVTVNNPPVLTLSGTNLVCYNDNSGAVNLTVTGNNPFGFAWIGPGGFTAGTEDISGLRAGTYYITVTDTKGCISSGSVILTEPGPVNAMLNYTGINCFGSAEGTITVSLPAGGSGIYEYTIDGGANWVNTGDFTGLNPGTYDVRMRDAMSPACFRILNAALVLTGSAQLNAAVTPANIVCYAANNGSVLISGATGGSGTYGYSVDGGASWQGSGSFANLGPGTYDVRIRDAAYPYCVMILNPALTISEPVQLTATVASTNISCFGSTDGSITISSPAGGHGTFEFSINGGGSWQSSGSYTNLAPGTYSVQIRDASYPACYRILDGMLLISQPAVLRANISSTMVTCFGADDGTITISGATGGSGGYEYSVDGGSSWQSAGTFGNLQPATYNIQIRDASHSGCVITLNSQLDITEPPALSGTVVNSDVTCFGAGNGRITITNPIGGYGSYEYTINGGTSWQTSNIFTGLSQGTYNVQMRDRVRTICVLILDPAVVINELNALSAFVQSSGVSCFNANNGTITIAGVSGGSGSYQYSINGGVSWQGSPDFINLAPGLYDVRIRDAVNITCGLIINPALVITEPAALSAAAASANVTCNGSDDGTITITNPSGGYGTYEYSINSGMAWQSSGSFTALSPGFYNVQIRDAAHTGCVTIINSSLRITEPAALRATVTSTNVTCNGADDGTITITSPAGGYGTYEYSIDGGISWQATGTHSNLAPGTFDVRIRDASQNSCIVILTPQLISEPAYLAGVISSTNITCFGADDGRITITNPTGGYGTYEYSIDGGVTWAGSRTFNNLAPRNYDVWIRDASQSSCFVTLTPQLISEPAQLAGAVGKTDVTCFGASDGTITITNPTGGYGTYEYSINGGGSWHASGLFTGLVPGNYNVRIRDAANNSCVIILNPALQITQPPVLNAVLTPVMVTCNSANDGQINITSPSGGYGTYEYSINGGAGWQASGTFGSLAPGNYDVRIRDAAGTGCVIVLNGALSITQPAALNASVSATNVTCFGAGDGRIIITSPSGGYGTYEYSIDGGTNWSATGSFTGLQPSTYDVRIRDRANTACSMILNTALVITQPAVLSAVVAGVNVTCNGAHNGIITISGPAGGYGTYQYTINGGAVWQSWGTFTNLAPGTYDVRIRDAANINCEIILNPALAITEQAALGASLQSTNVTCFGENDGTIIISSPSGGYGTYEYTTDGGGTWLPSGTFTGLAPGFYSVQIRDAAQTSCVAVINGSLRITEPAQLAGAVGKSDVTCFGANDGTLTITNPSGGYGTYEYSIDGTAWQSSGSFQSLAPGIYSPMIRDAANIPCFIILNPALEIIEPEALSAFVQSTNVTCNGANDAAITISSPTGGYGAYEFTINGGSTWVTTGSFTGLAPGMYNVQMRDRAHTGCVRVLDASLRLSQPPPLSATVAGTNITCYGASNGTITITGAAGGYGIYEFSINGGVSWQSSGSFTGLAPGSYNVRMRDAAYVTCVGVLNPALAITQPAALAATVAGTNVNCFGANDGTITISGTSGGYGTYEYTIDGGTTWVASGNFTGLTPGFYNVQVRDAANTGCVLVLNSSLRITEPAALNAMVLKTEITCFGANDGTITISMPTGGYGTYEYSIDGGVTWSGSGYYANLQPAAYDIMLRDASHNGCYVTLNPQLTLIEPAVLNAVVNSINVTCFGVNDGTITITNPTGGYGTYEYSVNGGVTWTGYGTFTNLQPATYDIRLRDAIHKECYVILNPQLVLTEPAALSAVVAGTNITCFGAGDGTITISSPAGGYGVYEYTINGGGSWQSSGIFTGLGPGNYNVRMRDASQLGCVRVLNSSLGITQPAMLNAITGAAMISCNGANDGNISITSPSGGYGTYEYSIDGGTGWQATGTFNNLVPGTYDVRLRDAVNIDCFVIFNPQLNITQPDQLAGAAGSTNVTCYGANDGRITVTSPSGGYGTYEYSIDGGANWSASGIFANLQPATYIIMIRDRSHNGCIVTLNPQLTITEPALLSATATASMVTCNGINNGIITISNPLGGYGTYSYSINGGGSWQNSETFGNLAPGIYDVRIRDAVNPACAVIINPALEITRPDALSASLQSTNVTCYGASDGTITIASPTGGYGTYEYTINGGFNWQSSGTFTALAPGYYNVHIRDAAHANCVTILNSSLRITEPPILAANVSSTNITCFAGNDGTITITGATGGHGTYEYSIDGGLTWSASGSFSNLQPATFDVRIRDASQISCFIILNQQLSITEPASLNAAVTSINVSCFGAGNGSISVSMPTGGSGTFEYSIDGGGTWSASGNFNNLQPATYDIRIRDRFHTGCIVILNPQLIITQPPVLNAAITGTNVTCFGGNDGTITINGASGGYGTYEYTINGGGSWQVSGSFTGLTTGSYNIRIRDAANTGCIIVLNNSYLITQPGMLSATISKTDVSCNGVNDGTITITNPTGGYGTYEYSIDGGVTWSNSGISLNLAPRTYDIRIRDAAHINCEIVLNAGLTITEPEQLAGAVGKTDVTCSGSNDGTITITGARGGHGTYEYSIDGGITWSGTGTFPNLAPRTYDIRIRDASQISCIITLTTQLISEPAQLAGTVGSTNVTCFDANDGTIRITSPTGGYGTYEYSTDGGIRWQSSGIFTNLQPATYDVRIRDAAHSGCIIILNPQLEITQPEKLGGAIGNTNVTCFSASDGTITITSPIGGYGTYEYSINGGAVWQASGSFTGLGPGYYNIQIRDAAQRNCVIILNSSLRLTEPQVLTAVVSRTNITCFGSNDGTITITGPTGGHGTYEYSIDGGATWSTSGSFVNLQPATYDIRLRDASQINCFVTFTPQLISETAILDATVTGRDVTCFGAVDGQISISGPTGGSGTYLYSINGGASWQGSGTFNNLAIGTYDVRIRDGANALCIITLNGALVISQPGALTASLRSTNVTCFGGNDGTITISGAVGGLGTYEYSINGGGSWQPSGIFSNLAPGTYNVMIRDAAHTGCVIVLNSIYIITQPGMLSATISKTEVTCRGNNDGTITISSPAGGYGTYEFSIDGGGSWQSTGTFNNLAPRTYSIWIRDAANQACAVILYPNLVITEPLTLAMSSTGNITLDCSGDTDGMGTFYVYGGTMPYSFIVDSNTTGGTVAAPGFNSLTFFSAGAGSITVTVVDLNGCSAQATINVVQPALLDPGSIAANQVVCFGDSPATLTGTIAPSGGPGAYIYQWQSAANAAGPFFNIGMATSDTYTPPAGVSYTIYYRRMVTSGLCAPVYSNVVEVRVNPLPIALLTGGETICPGQSSVLKVNLPAGTGPFTLYIENLGMVDNYISGSDIIVTPAVTTTYRLLEVRDANNCDVLAPSANLNGTATVIVSELPSITSFTPSPAVCEFTLAKFNVAASGTNLTYQWYENDGSGFNPVSDGGTYFGSLSPVLQIFNSVRTMNGYVYHVVVTGCGNSVTSTDAVFTVNTAPEITQIPADTTICMGQNTIMQADAAGTLITWQWYVNKGAGFILSVDDANFSGSTTRTLTITNAQANFNNWFFRATATGICGAPASTNLAVMRVLSPPTVTLQPVPHTICENGMTSFQANGRGYLTMQWEVFSGGVWSTLTEDATYLGTSSQMLNILNATVAMNGNQYRLSLTGSCTTVRSNAVTLTVNANPIVDFSPVDPIAACGGVPIVINGNPTGGSGTYSQHFWTGDVGPLNNYSSQSPVFNSVIPGSFALNYRVTDSNGCTSTGDVTVTVDSPSALFTQDVNYGCTPLEVTFTKDMTGLTKWWWDFGDGTPVDSVNANPVHTFTNNAAGSIEYYDVRLRVQSAAGCFDEFTSTITVFPGVDATFAPNDTIVCSGNTIIFTAIPGASRYFWDYGDGVSGYSTNVSNHLYRNFTTDPVVHTVSLITTSFFNCTDVKTFDITVMPVPIPQFTADPVTQVFNPAGTSVTFTNGTNAGNWSWLWKLGDNSTSTDMNPVHQYNDVGTYNVRLIVSNANCSDSIMHFVTIVPPAPVAMFDSIPSGCAPLYVNINNTSLNTDVPGTTYMWSFGDGSTSTAMNPTYTYFTPGDYRIELTVIGPGGVSVMSRVVRAYPSPKAHFEVAPSKVYVNDVSVRFFNLSQGATSLIWDFGDGDTSKVMEPFHKYMTEGIYDVTLWAYSENGCSDMYLLSPAVTVLPVGELRFPTVFKPNPTGPIERTDLPTGGTDVDMFFYPPIRETITGYKIQIFNRWGVLIFESHDVNVPWNGYYKGELCQQGVYVWLVEGKYQDGKPFKKAGNVTLLH